MYILITSLKCRFELVSQMSDVAHGPLVYWCGRVSLVIMEVSQSEHDQPFDGWSQNVTTLVAAKWLPKFSGQLLDGLKSNGHFYPLTTVSVLGCHWGWVCPGTTVDVVRRSGARLLESTHDNLRNEAYLRRGQYVSIVGNPRVILILSFIARGSALWRSLVFNQICMTSVTSPHLVKLHVMYACCSVSDQAWFSNQHGGINMCCYEMLWRSVLFLQLLYARWLRQYQ